MGIRFRCEYCKKRLNVKAKQAGEYCLCPRCEHEILVPSLGDESATIIESRRPSVGGSAVERDREVPSAGKTVVAEVSPKSGIFLVGSPMANSSPGVAELKSEAESRPARQSGATGASSAVDDSLLSESQRSTRSSRSLGDSGVTPPLSFPAAEDSSNDSGSSFMLGKPKIRVEANPLRSRPDHVWYARHRRHGEKGPLRSRDVEQLLDDGTLRADWIVWRQDWNDWLPADEVFPQLLVKENVEGGDYGIPEQLNPHSDASKAERRKKAILLSSIAAAFLLVIVLVYLLVRLY